MPGGDACEVLHAVRHNKLGKNPFVPVILTSWRPQPDLVRRVVDSGADDFLVKPLSPGKLLQRVEARSEEPTSELPSLMRTSSALFCLKKKTTITRHSKH